jgi:hypothetical protein
MYRGQSTTERRSAPGAFRHTQGGGVPRWALLQRIAPFYVPVSLGQRRAKQASARDHVHSRSLRAYCPASSLPWN